MLSIITSWGKEFRSSYDSFDCPSFRGIKLTTGKFLERDRCYRCNEAEAGTQVL